MLGFWASVSSLPDGVTHRIVLMRHAEPSAHTRGRCYGKLDVGLGDRGLAQAKAAAAAFCRGDLAAVVTSPRVRARDTARILADVVDAPVHEDARLAEIDFGEAQIPFEMEGELSGELSIEAMTVR